MVVDVVFVIGAGALDWGPGDEVIGWAFLGLSALSAGLLVAVSFALREPSYTGVMAATGLSYSGRSDVVRRCRLGPVAGVLEEVGRRMPKRPT